MFTGIITHIGTVRTVEPRGDTRLTIDCGFDTADLAIGASVACSGVCLTAVATGPGWFAADASAETLGATTLGHWRPGSRINLERSLRLGDEIGGHIVSGHVDAVARVVSVVPDGDSERWLFALPAAYGRFVAAKGSIALDGISLTVNHVDPGPGPGPDPGPDGAPAAGETAATLFGVNIIAHTRRHTTLGDRAPGDGVNVEIDMLARYVARLSGHDHPAVLRPCPAGAPA